MAHMHLDLEGEFKEMAPIMEEHEEPILAKPNVVGMGLSTKIKADRETGDHCIAVFVSQKLDKSMLRDEDLVPATLGKFKTDVVETGEIFAGALTAADTAKVEQIVKNLLGNHDLMMRETQPLPTLLDQEEEMVEEEIRIELLRQRVRPAMGGLSIGHYRVTAGTIATAVIDRSAYPGMPQRYYILSNNHVLANSNNARVGDPILQPGPVDGGRHPRDTIAHLTRWVNIRFGSGTDISTYPNNFVDAAIAEANFHDIRREVYWLGVVHGIGRPRLGEIVCKTGRTSNFTTGVIRAINATVLVNYGGGRRAKFIRQIMTSRMSAPGDSGSLVCNEKHEAVGLLFAGSSQVTICNDIRFVEMQLGIKIA